MKRYYFLILFLLIGLILPIPDYVELNHLMIVDSIGLDCSKSQYSLYLKEVIPKGGDDGIQYHYKIYLGIGNSIEDSYQNIVQNTHKKIFLDDTKSVITNCLSSTELIQYFSIHPKSIFHTKNSIKKELK